MEMTFEQIRSRAYRDLGDVLDLLRSDPSDGWSNERRQALRAIRLRIERARDALDDAAE